MKPIDADACTPCEGLARFIDVKGGITAEQALKRAALNLEFIKDKSLRTIDESLAALAAVRRTETADCAPELETRREWHAEATNIAALAGTFGLPTLSAGARLMCDYLDLMEETSSWNPMGAALHYDALICLRNESGTADCARVLEGLRKLSQHTAPRREAVRQSVGRG